MDKITATYYKEHAKEFIDSTMDCDMSTLYGFFEKHLRKDAKAILDIGFGSGRDSLYFSRKYNVTAIDPSIEFCKHAKEIGLKNVLNVSAQEMEFENQFDGIWACASLLHVPSYELNDVFKRCAKALKPGGVMYCSFKLGDFEGIRNERYYVDINDTELKKLLDGSGLVLKEALITTDVRPNRIDKWFNAVIVK